jgi:hypothetical protein
MLFIYQGKIIHRQVGAAPESSIRDTVTQFLDVVAETK